MSMTHLFIDSGAFSLGPLVKKGELKGEEYVTKTGKVKHKSWYDSKEYFEYIDGYCEFLKENAKYITTSVNVDVLDDPERTYRNQQYIEKTHGLRVVPVIHSFTEEKYINRYLDDGHDYIALGGMGGRQMEKRRQYKKWIDKVFTRLCPKSNDYYPLVKTHGFAVTSWHAMTRYPWYSVDSTTYAKMGGYGWLLVPRAHPDPDRRNEFDFNRPYLQIGVCAEPSPSVKARPKTRATWAQYDGEFISPHAAKTVGIPASFKHMARNAFKHIGPVERRNKPVLDHVLRWLDYIGEPFGVDGDRENNPGVCNHPVYRMRSNIKYFNELQKSRPAWPWRFHKSGGW